MSESGELLRPGLKEYIEAGYPCLFLPTVEPEVATRRIIQALEKVEIVKDVPISKVQFGIWKLTTGLYLGTMADVLSQVDGMKLKKVGGDELIDALDFVAKQIVPTMIVFHNIREFIKIPGIIQQLSDTVMVARTKGSCVFLVGAYLDVPPELRSLINFVDCPLPTREQIEDQYKKVVTAYEDDMWTEKAPKPSDEDLSNLIRHAATAAVGLDSMGSENALALSLATTGGIDIRVIQAQKEQEVKKSDVLEFVTPDATLDQVGGFSSFKEWLRKRQRVFTDEAREYGLPFPKGILIVGIAGSGKSLAAKAVSTYLKLPCLRLDIGKIYRSLVGESEAAVRMALQVTEAVAPVVLWIDEIDKAMAGVESSGNLDSGVTSRVTGTILTWRQETRAPIFVAATANSVQNLPAMVYRKGRFDEVWATDLPDEQERAEIFSIHLQKRKRDPKKFDLQALAKKADDFVGSEIESCIEDAMFSAFDKGKEVNTDFVLRSIEETIPQAKRDKEEVSRIREWVKTRARLVSGKDVEEKPKIGFAVGGRAVKVKRGGN